MTTSIGQTLKKLKLLNRNVNSANSNWIIQKSAKNIKMVSLKGSIGLKKIASGLRRKKANGRDPAFFSSETNVRVRFSFCHFLNEIPDQEAQTGPITSFLRANNRFIASTIPYHNRFSHYLTTGFRFRKWYNPHHKDLAMYRTPVKPFSRHPL